MYKPFLFFIPVQIVKLENWKNRLNLISFLDSSISSPIHAESSFSLVVGRVCPKLRNIVSILARGSRMGARAANTRVFVAQESRVYRDARRLDKKE